MTTNTRGAKYVSFIRTKQGLFLFAFVGLVSAIFVVVADQILRLVESFGLPAWVTLLALAAFLFVLVLGILNYNALVLITFALIGFVRIEPAPFDLLVTLVMGTGLLIGKISLPSSKYGILVPIGIGGFVLVNLASAFGSFQSVVSLRFLGITIYMLVLFVFVRIYTAQPAGLRIVMIGLTISAVINSLFVVLGLVGIKFVAETVDWSVRGVGFFKDPNVFGPFVAMAAFWVIDRLLQPPYRFKRTIWLATLALLLCFGAFSSLSRAVWLNFALGSCILWIVIFHYAPQKGIRLMALAFFFVVISLPFLQSSLLGDILKTRWQVQGYDIVRFSIQRDGITAGFNHLFGVGPAGWPNTHSLYIKTFAEQGIMGLASLLLIIGASVFPLFRYSWKEGERVTIITARVLLAIVAGQLLNSIVIDSIHWRHFWVVLGIAWAYPALRGRLEERNEA